MFLCTWLVHVFLCFSLKTGTVDFQYNLVKHGKSVAGVHRNGAFNTEMLPGGNEAPLLLAGPDSSDVVACQ